MLTDLGRTIGHYRLVEKIGEGGMGVVWKAEDTVLGRTVAVKVLPADVSRDEKRREMFLTEARLASSMSHAHIVQVHDFVREGDLDFIVMEYVEGTPLSKMLHGRPLAPDKASALGLQIATALAAAHRRSLVHRDLKPANLLVTATGDVKVVDFGLAVLFDTGFGEDVTRTSEDPLSARPHGGPAGTLAYMAPEQLEEGTVDARSDIFSLGVILYEMVTGEKPFRAATAMDLAQEILRGRPRPPHEWVSGLPLELERIVLKSLATDPGDRYQTMDDLAVDLKRLEKEIVSGSSPSYEDVRRDLREGRSRFNRSAPLGVAAVAAVGALALVGWWSGWWIGAAPDPKSVLVLPMDLRGPVVPGDDTGRSFAEAVVVNMAQVDALRVLPVPPGGERGGDDVERARREGAGRVVTGALTRRGDGFELTLSVTDVAERRVVWGAQLRAGDGQLPSLAANVASQIADKLGAALPREMYEYPLYLKGAADMLGSPEAAAVMEAWRYRRGDALAAAVALAREFPNEVGAHAVLAFLADQGQDDERLETALASLDRLAPGHPYREAFQGIREGRAGKSNGASDVLEALVSRTDVTPGFRAWILRSRGLYAVGKCGSPWVVLDLPMANDPCLREPLTRALSDLEEAARTDPANAWSQLYFAVGLHAAGRTTDAVERASRAAFLEPGFSLTLSSVGKLRMAATQWAGAISPLERACSIDAGSGDSCALIPLALLRAGRPDDARRKAPALEGRILRAMDAVSLSRYHAAAGSPSQSLALLDRAVQLGLDDPRLFLAREFDPLRRELRFERLAAKTRENAAGM